MTERLNENCIKMILYRINAFNESVIYYAAGMKTRILQVWQTQIYIGEQYGHIS